MDTEILEKIGLSKAEVKVYLTLLELGSTPSARVVHETGFRKSTVYNSIRRLVEKGIVSYVIRDSKKHFEAQDPERLIDYLQERKRLLDDQEEKIEKLIPLLRKGFTTLKPHAEAHVLAGIEGFKTMRRDALRNAGGEHLLIGSILRENEVMPEFFDNWNRMRQRKRIFWRILHKESVRKKEMKFREALGEHYEARFLPNELESPAVINIYGDRVVNVVWKKEHPICFMLINQDIADSYRKYFEYLWERASK